MLLWQRHIAATITSFATNPIATMPAIQELLEQRAKLDKEIAQAQSTLRADALTKIQALMAEADLSLSDLRDAFARTGMTKAARASVGAPKGGKVAPKYRNAETGDTWSGRGLQPNWLKAAIADGKKLEDFAI